MLECLAAYSVEKMPYAILPKYSPSGHKKVFRIIFHRLNLVFGPVKLMSCAFWSSGGDAGGVEQARYRKLGPPVDHHSGHPGWFTASGSAHLRLIQGENSYILYYRSEALYLFPFFFNFTKISGRNI